MAKMGLRANATRAHLGDFGLVVPKGVHNMDRLVKEAEADETVRRLQR